MHKWNTLCKILAVEEEPASFWFTFLVDHYREPSRYYHTLTHVNDLLRKLEERSVQSVPSCELAIWFHDVIYDTQDPSLNEVKSAEACKDFLTSQHIEGYDVVVNYILATQKHAPLTGDADELEFLDLDMSILGAQPDIYDAYSANVRQEYVNYSDEVYREKRTAFLIACKAREQLFLLPHNQAQWTSQARENMQREVDSFNRLDSSL